MNMYQFFRKAEATANRRSAMECRDHSKNTASVEKGVVCPSKSTNTNKQNNVWVCWDCGNEF